MRRESIAWERAGELHGAADGWLRAGAIDLPTHAAIRDAFPDPCVTPSAVWRILTSVIVTAVVLCTFSAFMFAARVSAEGLTMLAWVFAGTCFVATELLERSPRLARRGVAGATAFWGCVLFLAALALFLQEIVRIRSVDALDIVLLAGVLIWAIAGWRWGTPLFAALSSAALFILLTRWPDGRWLWVVVGVALAGLAARGVDDVSLAPSHRRAATVLVVAGIAAVYAALNVYSLDYHLVESLRPFGPQHAASPRRPVFVVAAIVTAVLPLGILTWAVRSRRTVLLDVGIVLLALSLVTLRHYVHVAPLWTVLTIAGMALIGVALSVERVLRRAPGRELFGFTADPLFSDERRRKLLQVVPVVGAFAPAAVTPARPDEGFVAGGGGFGGAGASEKF